MGKEGIRYAAKVDLEKDAATQPHLHVSQEKFEAVQRYLLTDLESMAPRQYV